MATRQVVVAVHDTPPDPADDEQTHPAGTTQHLWKSTTPLPRQITVAPDQEFKPPVPVCDTDRPPQNTVFQLLHDTHHDALRASSRLFADLAVTDTSGVGYRRDAFTELLQWWTTTFTGLACQADDFVSVVDLETETGYLESTHGRSEYCTYYRDVTLRAGWLVTAGEMEVRQHG